jgi:predicted Zn-dependent peptidase
MNRRFDAIGAQYNAFTTQEITAYYASVLPEFTEEVVEHLGHLFRPALREADFEIEKKVILEEIAMYADDPGHRIFERAMAEHFAGHPLAMSILGPVETIETMSRDDMAAYHAANYGPRNTALAVAGQFDFDQLCEMAERHYGTWEPVGAERTYSEPSSVGNRTDLKDEKLNRLYAMGLCPGPSAQDETRYAARVLSDLLGDGDGSRLYWALVDPAICDEADFGPYSHDRTGSFALSVTCDPARGDEAIDIAMRELARVRNDLSADEVERSKQKIAGEAVLHGESVGGRMRAIGMNWIYLDKYVSLDEELDALLAVDINKVQALLEQYRFDPMTIVTLSP